MTQAARLALAGDMDRAIPLASGRVLVIPQRLQRVRVEGFQTTVGQRDEHLAVGIGRRHERVCGGVVHGRIGYALARVLVELGYDAVGAAPAGDYDGIQPRLPGDVRKDRPAGGQGSAGEGGSAESGDGSA